MENKIRKIIREQIKKLKEGNNSIRIFGSKDMKDYIVDVSINDASSNTQNIKGLTIIGGLNQSNQYAEEELNDFDINYIDGCGAALPKFTNSKMS